MRSNELTLYHLPVFCPGEAMNLLSTISLCSAQEKQWTYSLAISLSSPQEKQWTYSLAISLSSPQEKQWTYSLPSPCPLPMRSNELTLYHLPVLSPWEAMNLLSTISLSSPQEKLWTYSLAISLSSPLGEAMNLLSSHFSVLSPGEAVPELWVSELVEPAGSRDTEVPPDVLTGPEVQLLHRPGTRLETLSNEVQDPKIVT